MDSILWSLFPIDFSRNLFCSVYRLNQPLRKIHVAKFAVVNNLWIKSSKNSVLNHAMPGLFSLKIALGRVWQNSFTRKTLIQDYFTITSPCRPKNLKNKSVPDKSWSLFLVYMLLYFVQKVYISYEHHFLTIHEKSLLPILNRKPQNPATRFFFLKNIDT